MARVFRVVFEKTASVSLQEIDGETFSKNCFGTQRPVVAPADDDDDDERDEKLLARGKRKLSAVEDEDDDAAQETGEKKKKKKKKKKKTTTTSEDARGADDAEPMDDAAAASPPIEPSAEDKQAIARVRKAWCPPARWGKQSVSRSFLAARACRRLTDRPRARCSFTRPCWRRSIGSASRGRCRSSARRDRARHPLKHSARRF